MKSFPEGLTVYRKTRTFNVKNVPAGILKNHTSAVWAKIIVVSGTLDYLIEELATEKTTLDSGQFGVIEPHVKHRVILNDQSEFYIEFYS